MVPSRILFVPTRIESIWWTGRLVGVGLVLLMVNRVGFRLGVWLGDAQVCTTLRARAFVEIPVERGPPFGLPALGFLASYALASRPTGLPWSNSGPVLADQTFASPVPSFSTLHQDYGLLLSSCKNALSLLKSTIPN